jgi:hypothetical protein
MAEFSTLTPDLLWFTEKGCEVCNFAYDTILFVCCKDIEEMKDKLEKNADIAILWLKQIISS